MARLIGFLQRHLFLAGAVIIVTPIFAFAFHERGQQGCQINRNLIELNHQAMEEANVLFQIAYGVMGAQEATLSRKISLAEAKRALEENLGKIDQAGQALAGLHSRLEYVESGTDRVEQAHRELNELIAKAGELSEIVDGQISASNDVDELVKTIIEDRVRVAALYGDFIVVQPHLTSGALDAACAHQYLQQYYW